MRRYLRAATALTLAATLPACAAMNSIHWSFPGPGEPGKTRVITIDAKQRNLIMARDMKGNLRTCSEVAPDAFSVFASSLAGGFDLGGANKNAQVSQGYSETAATLERTQTYNLLRTSLFRTCELWLSGALDQDEFMALAARTHRSMVAVLAIEQMTGVVKPPSVVISGPAVRAMQAQTEELAKLVEKYRGERETAEAAETAANKAKDEANILVEVGGEQKRICSASEAPDGKDEEFKKCKDAELAATTAKGAADKTREREDAVLKELGALSGGLAAATSQGSYNAGGIDQSKQRISDTTMAIVAKAAENIALTSGINESLMFCAGYLRKGADQTTRRTCESILVQAATNDTAVRQSISTSEAFVPTEAGLRFDEAFRKLIKGLGGISDDTQRQSKVLSLMQALSPSIPQRSQTRISTECKKSTADCIVAVTAGSALFAASNFRTLMREF